MLQSISTIELNGHLKTGVVLMCIFPSQVHAIQRHLRPEGTLLLASRTGRTSLDDSRRLLAEMGFEQEGEPLPMKYGEASKYSCGMELLFDYAIRLVTTRLMFGIWRTLDLQLDKRQSQSDCLSDFGKQISRISNHHTKILLTDNNGTVSRDDDSSDFVGPFGSPTTNKNGELLTKFCAENDMFLTDTLYQHKPHHRWTFKGVGHSLDAPRTQIDFIATQRKDRRLVKDSRTFPGIDLSCPNASHTPGHHISVVMTIANEHTRPKKVAQKPGAHFEAQRLQSSSRRNLTTPPKQ